jgi:DNA-directed RNA polymerase specialized sigma24 family protein
MPVSRWSLVFRARAGDETAARALGELIALYWEPLYLYARRRGWSVEDAQDAVQGFAGELVRREAVKRADQARGRLRTFFLSAFENYLAEKWRAGQTLKRGGAATVIPLDVALAERHFAAEPADTLSPDRLFDRRWIATLLERVLARLRAEHEAAGKGALFELLQSALARDAAHFGYAEAGAALGLSENAVKKAVARLRARYREALLREIAETLCDPADAEAELRSLLAVFA